jgi:hypothetical protein
VRPGKSHAARGRRGRAHTAAPTSSTQQGEKLQGLDRAPHLRGRQIL